MQVASVNCRKMGFECKHLQLNGLRLIWRKEALARTLAEGDRNTISERIGPYRRSGYGIHSD